MSSEWNETCSQAPCNRLTADQLKRGDGLRDEITHLHAELARWVEAFGTVSTLAGKMEVDTSNPAKMAQEILAAVSARDQEQRRKGAVWALRQWDDEQHALGYVAVQELSAMADAIERGDVEVPNE